MNRKASLRTAIVIMVGVFLGASFNAPVQAKKRKKKRSSRTQIPSFVLIGLPHIRSWRKIHLSKIRNGRISVRLMSAAAAQTSLL